jgi:hypothetical protein
MRRPQPKKAPKPAMPAGQLLAAVPCRNEAMKAETVGDGLLVSIPVRRPGWMVPPISWVLPFSERRRVELDPAGRAVLDLCDGIRTVEEVIERFGEEHRLSFRESQLSVTRFLRELLQRGIIVLASDENS